MNTLRFACLVLVLAQAGSASADSLWLVTRVDVDTPKPAGTKSAGTWSVPPTKPADAEAVRKLAQVLRARGLDVIEGVAAAGEFERRHSRMARPLPAATATELDTSLRKLADELASENLENAQALQADIDALSPDIRDQLNHETPRARRRFHICLLTAHLFSKGGSQTEAGEQIRKCARDFPGLEPEQGPYLPDSIRKFFAHAHEELAQIRPSTVHVDVENYTERDCRARVNGIDRGPTPATVDEIRTQRVRIQVDCGQRSGRIYDVELQPGENSLRIDPQLDRAVVTEPALALRYPALEAATNNRLLHSLRLARAIEATYVVEIWNGELHRIDVATRRDTTVGELSTPIEELVDEMLSVPESGAHAAEPLALGSPAPAQRAAPFATLGWVTAGTAVAAGIGVLVAWRVREGAVADFNDENVPCESPHARNQPAMCKDMLDTADTWETAMYVLGFTGIGLAGLAATFFALDAGSDSHESSAAATRCGLGPGELGVACRVTF